MRLNADYSDIKRQLIELEEGLKHSPDKDDFYSKYMTFGALNYVYGLRRRSNIFLSNEIEEFGIKCYDESCLKAKENFLSNKLYHREILGKSFDEASEAMVEIALSRYFRRKHFPRIRDGERSEILEAFFKDSFPEGRDILEELLEDGHLYRFDSITTMGVPAFTIFNTDEKFGNVFLYKKPRSVVTLASLIHEMGHVHDYLDVTSTFSNSGIIDYSVNSIFVETLSCYYNQLFLEYLLKNGIREEEVIFSFKEFFTSLFSYLESGLLLTLLSENEYRKVCDGNVMKEVVVKSLLEKKIIEEGEYSFSSLSSMMSGIDENRYSYGILISNMIINGEISLDDFMSIRGKDFNKESLESIGFSASKATKSLVRTMNRTMIKKI